jgi:O-antigen ligase
MLKFFKKINLVNLMAFQVFSIFLFIGLLFKRKVNNPLKNLKKGIKPAIIPLIGFMLTMFLAIVAHNFEKVSLRHYIFMIWVLLTVIIYFIYVNNSKELIKSTKFLLFVGFVISVAGTLIFFLYLLGNNLLISTREGKGLIYMDLIHNRGRLRLFNSDPNAYAAYMLPLLFNAIGWFFINVKKRRLIYGVLLSILLILINLVFTFSRAALISLSVALLLMVFLLVVYKNYNDAFSLFSSFLFSFIIFIFILKLINVDPNYILSGFYFRQPFEESRYIKWIQTLNIIKNNLFWGIGEGNLSRQLGFQAHNSFLELLAENGIFPFIFLLWFIIEVLFKSIKIAHNLFYNKDLRAYMLLSNTIGFVALIIVMFSVSILTLIYFWFYAMLILVMANIFFREKDKII